MGDPSANIRSQSHAAYFNNDSFASSRNSSGSFAGKESWKLSNLDKEAMLGVIEEEHTEIKTVYKESDQELSEIALEKKGILSYIEEIPLEKRKPRVKYGFLKKSGRGKISIDHKRWCFMISSRPLDRDSYLTDSEQINEDYLPPLIEFDCMYYYEMDSKDDSSACKGSIKCLEVDKMELKSDSKNHTLYIDAGPKKYEFQSQTKFILQEWQEAIELGKRTASERLYSITGSIKNISMIVTEFEMDADRLSERLTLEAKEIFSDNKVWDSLDSMLNDCTKLSQEFFSIFDACLVQIPPRKDLIKLYMNTQHVIMCEAMGKVWEKNALNYNLIEIMSFCDWIYEYIKGLQKFGVSDDSIKNGFISLCNSYKRKVHLQLYPMVTNALIGDKKGEPYEVDQRGQMKLYTNGPKDIFKIFNEILEVIQAKRVKELTLRVLEVIHQILIQYQQALLMMIRADDSLSTDFLIAQANNCGTIFDLIQAVLEPIKAQKICTDEELEKAFDDRKIEQNSFKIITEVTTKVSDYAYLQTRQFYVGNFMDMNLDDILNKSIAIYEEIADKMNISASREAWKCFMKKSMAAYIQILLNSSSKIKEKKSDEAVQKIQKDYSIFERSFEEFMSKKTMRPSLEVIGDVKNFFESSPDFLGVSIEKMRNLHGPSFNFSTVKALLNLRTDLSKQEKISILGECKEILANFSNTDKGKTEGIFNNIDTKSGAAECLKDMAVADGENDGDDHIMNQFKDDEEDDFDINAFLKDGGVDLEEIESEESKKNKKLKTKTTERDKVVEIKGSETMKGYLFTQVSSVDESSQFLGKIFSTVTNTVNMVADTIHKKRTKRFFTIKNRRLFIYKAENSDQAEEDILIKDIEGINNDEESKKEFYFIYKRKVFRMEAKSAAEAEMWVKSIELVMSKSEEYLNLDRYVDEKVFSKITGKSLFKDYESILEEYRKKLWEEEMRKRKIEEEKKIEEERKKLEELGKKKGHKVAGKKDVPDLELKKVRSEMPPLKAAESIPVRDEDNTPIHPIQHKSTFRTEDVQAENIDFTDDKDIQPELALFNVKSEKIEIVKKDFLPVQKEDKSPFSKESNNSNKNVPKFERGDSGKLVKADSSKFSRVDSSNLTREPSAKIEFTLPISTSDDFSYDKNNKKQIKETQPLLKDELSDEDDDFKGFGINQSNKSNSKNQFESNQNNEVSEEIANLIQLDNQRKESMYDILMKKEESKKLEDKKKEEIKKNTEGSSSVKSSDAKPGSERGYEGDQSRINSTVTGSKTSMQTNRPSNTTPTRPPEVRVGEPITTTSCFGSCWNGIMGIFKRR